MDITIKETFLKNWKKYFNNAELPITFYYTNEQERAKLVPPPGKQHCLIAELARVRRGKSLCFENDSLGCSGAKRYLGFTETLRPEFDYFLSCGIPGKLEGERYKKTPELVNAIMANAPKFKAPARYIIFKRWDFLEEQDNPDAVIFFEPPDVLSGLFTLAGYDEQDLNAVFVPFSAGCGSIVQYPYLERTKEHPRCVLGMFDVSARPHVPSGTLTFSVPINKFLRMINDMDESFLITSSWKQVRRRIK